MLSLHDLACGYDSSIILNELNGEIDKGQVTFVVGPNGCGKTTLLRTVAGFLPALNGSISAIESSFAYLPANLTFHEELTGNDLLDLYSSHESSWHSPGSIELFEVSDLLTKPLISLSSGEIQRIWLVAVLSHKSPFVILDEPLNHLDWSHGSHLASLISEHSKKGRSFLISNHDLGWSLKFATSRTWVLSKKKCLIQGETEEVLVDEITQEIFNFRTSITDNPIDKSRLFATADHYEKRS